ncbi:MULTISPECIES: type III secretion HpaP family protein [unclassified Caballeronia]|uniref:type III secretion HpaP family protein n=1 Tax=unclassified Caballeronia TaxID=2646786 RepID=UPI0020286730|nr:MULTISPECIES: type III secretion HpaP family protein [unclassified Caballeronia]
MIDRKGLLRIYRPDRSEALPEKHAARRFSYLMLARRLRARAGAEVKRSAGMPVDTDGFHELRGDEAPHVVPMEQEESINFDEEVLQRLSDSSHAVSEALFSEQSKIDQFAQSIAEGIVEFCQMASVEMTGTWDVVLPLKESFPSGSQILITLSLTRLAIVFDIPDESILSLLMKHVHILTARIDGILRMYGNVREIEIARR